ncbi:MAG: LamG domain-containing protein, partial [bacterium]
WPLDTVHDEFTLDQTGRSPGVVLGPDTGVPGKVGQAMDFHRDTDRIRVDNQSIFENMSAVSVSGWIRPRDYAKQFIVTKGIPDDGKLASPFGLSLTESGDIVFSVNTDKGFTQIRKVGYELNEWTFVVGTYDGSRVSLYVDGKKVTDVTVGGKLKDSGLPLFLGSRYGAFGGFNGLMDDIRIYNYALTESEIKALPGLSGSN